MQRCSCGSKVAGWQNDFGTRCPIPEFLSPRLTFSGSVICAVMLRHLAVNLYG